MPVRILAGVGALVAPVLAHYGLTPRDVEAMGGAIYAGNALLKNANFDIIISSGVLAGAIPGRRVWYEVMSLKRISCSLPSR